MKKSYIVYHLSTAIIPSELFVTDDKNIAEKYINKYNEIFKKYEGFYAKLLKNKYEYDKKPFAYDLYSYTTPKAFLREVDFVGCKHKDKFGNNIETYVSEINRWYCSECDSIT